MSDSAGGKDGVPVAGAPVDDARAAGSVAGRAAVVLAAAAGCTVVVLGWQGSGGYAKYRGAGRPGVIRLGPDVIQAAEDCQRWVAAHEVAHLVLRHRQLPVWPILSGSVVLLLTVGLSLAAVFGGVVWAAAALWVVAVVQLVVSMAWSSRRSRSEEVAADDLATDWGVPITLSIADWVERGERRRGRIWLFRGHPKPRARVARQAMRARDGRI